MPQPSRLLLDICETEYFVQKLSIRADDTIRQRGNPLVLPWPYSEGKFYCDYRRLIALAGLPNDRKSKAHRMRVSHATWAKVAGDNPTERMGHASALTFYGTSLINGFSHAAPR